MLLSLILQFVWFITGLYCTDYRSVQYLTIVI